jgi:hypothetical protein
MQSQNTDTQQQCYNREYIRRHLKPAYLVYGQNKQEQPCILWKTSDTYTGTSNKKIDERQQSKNAKIEDKSQITDIC